MTRKQLLDLYDGLKKLEGLLQEHKAPAAVRRRAHEALLAVSWEIDYRD
jgi:hypothetical protein